MRSPFAASMVILFALVAFLATEEGRAAQRGRITGEGFVSEGVPRMPDPPGPAPKRDLSGAWVGPQNNKPDPVPPMTPAGEAQFKLRKAYGPATGQRASQASATGEPPSSNDPFITCDPLGFPRDLLAHAISSRGGMLFGAAPNRLLIAYEQQRVWREVWMDGRALPKAVDVRGAPESRYYGYSVGHWENDNTLVVDTTGVDERPWLDEAGHPRSSSARIQERYTRPDQYNLQLTVTVDDPKFYTKPWTWMRANFYWMKAQEFVETLCIPSEAIEYRDTLARPSGIEIR
ncbi:MAG: hypothetical protein HY824_04235 [Acidobacteria bacterium]|nr:hypothetical protein [Acidobacteriota bacterium]